MPVVKATFDGRVFVPAEPVDLPAGLAVDVVLPAPPPALTPEEMKEWEEILDEIRASPPHFPTVEDAISYTRKRPYPEPRE